MEYDERRWRKKAERRFVLSDELHLAGRIAESVTVHKAALKAVRRADRLEREAYPQ